MAIVGFIDLIGASAAYAQKMPGDRRSGSAGEFRVLARSLDRPEIFLLFPGTSLGGWHQTAPQGIRDVGTQMLANHFALQLLEYFIHADLLLALAKKLLMAGIKTFEMLRVLFRRITDGERIVAHAGTNGRSRSPAIRQRQTSPFLRTVWWSARRLRSLYR